MGLNYYRKEYYYRVAKEKGYRARSAFKLKQIQAKYKVMKQGDLVIDLGCAPGSWSQVAKETVGEEGLIIGIDLLRVQPIQGVIFLQGDITKKESIDNLMALLKEKAHKKLKADVVLSDLSPKLSGSYGIDQARSVWLVKHAFRVTKKVLSKGGSFVCKVFEGEDYPLLFNELKNHFQFLKAYRPPASRKESSEIYLIGKGFKQEI
jgi:23S rRNA (uridine2552-2'-O)-methyltransferase